jgi:hypothetical protein
MPTPNNAEYLPERRQMMQWWADYLEKVKAKKTGHKQERH